jgi:hypothetical protein
MGPYQVAAIIVALLNTPLSGATVPIFSNA